MPGLCRDWEGLEGPGLVDVSLGLGGGGLPSHLAARVPTLLPHRGSVRAAVWGLALGWPGSLPRTQP